MIPAYIKTPTNISIVFPDGFSHTIYHTQQAKYDKVVALIKQANASPDVWDRIRIECEPAKEIKEKFEANVSLQTRNINVDDGQVFVDGKRLHNTITKRMLDMIKDGFDISSLVLFLDNLYDNPSKTAVDELYDFLEKGLLPITEDGHFLAYKRVTSDFKDQYTKTIDNSVGTTVSMRRNQVNEDRNNTCSDGLHFCSRSYLSSYSSSNGGQVVIVKINPEDVVSIPKDYNNAKGRCCRYEVMQTLNLKKKESTSLPVEEIEGSFKPSPKQVDINNPVMIPVEGEVPEIISSERMIARFDIASQKLRYFDTLSEAANVSGLPKSSIRRVLTGLRKSTGGYNWSYGTPDDPSPKEPISIASPDYKGDAKKAQEILGETKKHSSRYFQT